MALPPAHGRFSLGCSHARTLPSADPHAGQTDESPPAPTRGRLWVILWYLWVHFGTFCHILVQPATRAKFLNMQGFCLFSRVCETTRKEFQDRRFQPLTHPSTLQEQ